MKKHVFGRKFKRDKNERQALFKGLMTSLVMHESIQTTEEKAKAIKASFDKLITTAKKGGQVAYRALEAEVSTDAAKKLVNELAIRTKDRQGGYTRIMKLGKRFNDDAMVVMMELVDKKPVAAAVKKVKKPAGATIVEGETVESTVATDTKKTVVKSKTKKAAGKKPVKKEKTTK